MKTTLIAAFLLASAGIGHAQSHPAPLDDAGLVDLFEPGDFAELEKIAEQARASKERNGAGDWQLAAFYDALFGAARLQE